MTSGSIQTKSAAPGLGDRRAASRSTWILLVALAIVEVMSALYLTSLNPVRGYDENAYTINAHAMRGVGELSYAVHRPPLLPMMQAALGEHRWIISGLAHIGATALLFLILRRLVPIGVAIAGVMVFMLSGDMRYYNIVALTEMPGVLLTLLAVYLFLTRRPFALGVVATLLVTLHWSMVSVVGAIGGVYLLTALWNPQPRPSTRRNTADGEHPEPRALACADFPGPVDRHRAASGDFDRQRTAPRPSGSGVRSPWRDPARYILGGAVAAIPLLVLSANAFGNPLAPVLGSFEIQRGSVNDWSYYLRTFPQLPVALIVGGGVGCVSIVRRLRRRDFDMPTVLFALLIGMVLCRLILVHLYESKAERYLIPLFPALLIVTVVMIARVQRRPALVRVALWALLVVSVAPSKKLLYEMYALANDPAHAVVALEPAIDRLDPALPIYTDLNDMAVMGHTGRATVAVTGANSWHHYLSSRPAAPRSAVPQGAAYLTFDAAGSRELASAPTTHGRTLSLVRWNGGNPVQTAAVTPSRVMKAVATGPDGG